MPSNLNVHSGSLSAGDGGTDAQTEVESRRVAIALLLEVVGGAQPTFMQSGEV